MVAGCGRVNGRFYDSVAGYYEYNDGGVGTSGADTAVVIVPGTRIVSPRTGTYTNVVKMELPSAELPQVPEAPFAGNSSNGTGVVAIPLT